MLWLWLDDCGVLFGVKYSNKELKYIYPIMENSADSTWIFQLQGILIYANQYKQPVSHCQKIDQRKRWAFLLIKNLAFLTYFWSLWNVIWNSLRLISRIVIYFKLLLRVSTLDIPQIIKCVTQWIILWLFWCFGSLTVDNW